MSKRSVRIPMLVALCGAALSALAQFDEALPDPTVPLDYVVSSASADNGNDSPFALAQGLLGLVTSYKLSSVLIRSDDRVAIINGERLREGDRIGSATVASIESNRVQLNIDGEIETLELYENSIKTPVKGDE